MTQDQLNGLTTAEHHRQVLEQLFPTLPRFPIEIGRTAVVVIDMQYLDAHPDFGLGRRARELGIAHLLAGYFGRCQEVTRNLQLLLTTCRQYGVEVIHVIISANTEDSRDCSEVSRALEIRPPRSSRESDILDELRPAADEIVLTKITSGAFNSTSLDLVLHNMDIDTLILGGVVTNGCVETTARDARDLGYRVIIASDGCTAMSEDAHRNALHFLSRTRGNVRTVEEIIAEIAVAPRAVEGETRQPLARIPTGA
jgi:nicotinamidase-related amidase